MTQAIGPAVKMIGRGRGQENENIKRKYGITKFHLNDDYEEYLSGGWEGDKDDWSGVWIRKQ
jgi:hypothetical protein